MTARNGEWRRGWPVVAGAMGSMMVVAAPSSIVGLVMLPLQEEFGWSRAQITTSLLIVSLCALVFAPLAGAAINRFGPRPVTLVSVLTTGAAFTLIASSGPTIWTWFGAWAAYGLLSIALGPIVWSSALSSLFDQQRGLALSVAMSGSGLAFAVWPPIVTLILAEYGWREVYLLLAAIALIIILPLNFAALHTLRRRPAAPVPPSAVTSISRLEPEPLGLAWGPTLGLALREGRFWRMALALIIAAGVNGSLAIHFYPILSELHFAPGDAAYLVALIGPAMIGGRIFSGWLMDRLFAPFVIAIALALPAMTILILIFSPTLGMITVGSILLGASTGALTGGIAYLVSRYFGLRHYASIFGVLIGIFGVSFGLLPVLTGHFYDVAGSYAPLFPVMMAATVPTALLLATLGRYPQGQSSMTP